MLSSFHGQVATAMLVAVSWLAAPCAGLQTWDGSRIEPIDFGVKVVREMQHVGKPWTQGLEFTEEGDALVETSGSFPPGTQSFVRMLDAQTGTEISKTTAGFDHGTKGHGRFAEGISQLGSGPASRWFASTYTDDVIVEYDQDFKQVAEHQYPFEGWGLVRNADSTGFFATNGSAHIMELAPDNFQVQSVKTARCHDSDVPGINELEMVQNFMGRGPALLGNVMGSRLVIALDPSSMNCIGAFHLESLGDVQNGEQFGLHVANGIAFNRQTGNFVVTGKNWDRMYEISLEEHSSSSSSDDGALALLAIHLGINAVPESRSSRSTHSTGRHALRSSNPQ